MPRLLKTAAIGFALLLSLVGTALAAVTTVPNMLQYQGRLTDNAGAPLNGAFNVTFTIYSDSLGTTSLWTETRPLTIANGLFSVTLGTGVAIPATVSNGIDRFLGIKVAPDAADMLPRQRLAAVAFALRAASAEVADALSNVPGIASTEHTSTLNVTTGNTVPIDSVDITIPGPGFIQVEATGVTFANQHVNGTFGLYFSRVSEARFDTGIGAGWGYGTVAAGLPAGGNYASSIAVSRTYVKATGGTYRYYFNFFTSGEPWLVYPFSLTARYYPVAYGAVAAPAMARPTTELMRLQTTDPANAPR